MNDERRFPKAWIFGAVAAALLLVVPVMAFRSPQRAALAGSVTWRGKPVVMGTVVALAADGQLRSTPIDDRGHYAFDNLPCGKVQLGVITRDPSKASMRQQKMTDGRVVESEKTANGVANKSKWFAVPPAFEDPRGSGVETTLQSASEFEIKMQ